MIEVKNVRRVFKSAKKEEGVAGAFKLLVKPQVVEHEALKGVSFSIEPGAFVGLIGANGAGKTTILKILSGLIPPTSGEARVMGFDPFKRHYDFRRQIALVMGQKAQLWWDLPATDAFDLLQAIYEIPKKTYRERIELLTTMLDVKTLLGTQIRRLSLGERMKMELIGALLHWPSVIFLDEPTIGLDVFAAQKLRQFLREFNQREKATIILTSHNMDDIESLCSRILIMRTGELIFDGAPQKLVSSENCRVRLRFKEHPTLSELSQVSLVPESKIEIQDGEDEERNLLFEIKPSEMIPLLQRMMGKFSLLDMRIEEQSLESVIERLYAAGSAGKLPHTS